MASNLLKIHIMQTIKPPKHPLHYPRSSFSPSSPFPTKHHHHLQYQKSHLSIFPSKSTPRSKVLPLTLQCNGNASSPTPPSSKEEAILQAKKCLSTTLEKPLNNPKLAGKLKKLKQPRYRLEIPVINDDSPDSLSQLALQVFGDIPIRRKGSKVKVLILWPNKSLTDAASKAFSRSNSPNIVEHLDISCIISGDIRNLGSADVAVFFVPETSQLAVVKTVSDSFYPRPVVVFNPRWGFEQESGFGELGGFVGSFEVVYSFMGLEVRGILSNRKGMVYKCVKDGVVSGEKWSVLVEEKGALKVVSRFKTRPSITEVENVLYNLMAINSPITKSAKFLRDLVSNVTGKK